MNRHFKNLLILVFLMIASEGFCQQDTLLLYTKPGCSNCHNAKEDLRINGIPYFEKSLDINENGVEVMDRMNKIGYKEKIYLPVIFLNNKLMHPAFQYKDTLKTVNIEVAMDSLKRKVKRGELHLAIPPKPKVEKAAKPEVESDCDLQKPMVYYLICANFLEEKDAKDAMNRLIDAGYTFAGIVKFNGTYKVYSKFFYDKSAADIALEDAKKVFKEAFLLDIPK